MSVARKKKGIGGNARVEAIRSRTVKANSGNKLECISTGGPFRENFSE